MTHDNLLRMELEFLSALNWNVYVSNDEFFEKVQSLEVTLARRQGLHRGWFTYMELNTLLPSIKLAKQLLHLTVVLGLSYTALVTTMVASVFLVSQIPGSYLNVSHRPSTDVGEKAFETANGTQPMENQTLTPLPGSEVRNSDNIIDSDRHTTLDLTLGSLIESVNKTSNIQNRTEAEPTIPTDLPNLLKTETFDWDVIARSLSDGRKHDFCMENDFDKSRRIYTHTNNAKSRRRVNSTVHYVFTFNPATEIKTSLNGIKMKWV